jgi:Uncharacterized protein conserved in bacteria (DUF2188)
VAPSRTIEVRSVARDDWVVREDGGRELGHYPSAKAAEAVGRKLQTQGRAADLRIYAQGGKLQARSRPGAGWLRRLFAT